MPQSVMVQEGSDVVVVEYFGSLVPEETRTSLEAIELIAQDRGLRKVLLDLSMVLKITSNVDAFSHVYEVSRNEALGSLRYAFIRSGNMPGLSRLMTEAANKRGVECRDFSTQEEALDWLNSPVESD